MVVAFRQITGREGLQIRPAGCVTILAGAVPPDQQAIINDIIRLEVGLRVDDAVDVGALAVSGVVAGRAVGIMGRVNHRADRVDAGEAGSRPFLTERYAVRRVGDDDRKNVGAQRDAFFVRNPDRGGLQEAVDRLDPVRYFRFRAEPGLSAPFRRAGRETDIIELYFIDTLGDGVQRDVDVVLPGFLAVRADEGLAAFVRKTQHRAVGVADAILRSGRGQRSVLEADNAADQDNPFGVTFLSDRRQIVIMLDRADLEGQRHFAIEIDAVGLFEVDDEAINLRLSRDSQVALQVAACPDVERPGFVMLERQHGRWNRQRPEIAFGYGVGR